MKMHIAAATLAALLFAPASAYADGLYGKAEGGVGFSGTLDDSGLSADLETGYQLGGAIGYAYPSGLRLEGELAYTKNDIDTQGLGVDADVSAVAGFANVYYDFGKGKVRPFVGAGIGYAQGEASASAGGFTLSTDGSGVAYQLRAGVSFATSENVAWDIGYRYISADIEDTEAEIHGATVGVRFKLGS